MILNMNLVIELLIEDICLNSYDEKPQELDGDIDYLHDMCLNIKVCGLNPEENVIMYGELLSILNVDGKEIADTIDDFVEEEFCSYYGDPAFASASDYWNYILG